MSTVKEKFILSRIYGAIYEIYNPQFGNVHAVLKGRLRLGRSEERHPFVVGDRILAEPGTGEEWVILEKEERKNFLTRKSVFADTHVLCSNVDNLLIIASLESPVTKDSFIDRCLAAAFFGKIHPLIVFNKTDLAKNALIEDKQEKYNHLGYEVYTVSCLEEGSIEVLKNRIAGQTTFFAGNSGVGKSSLLNLISGIKIQSIGNVSISTQKGRHTTTNTRAIFLEENTILIDSPGIKEWGLLHLQVHEALETFPEFWSLKEECQSVDCCNGSKRCEILKNREDIEISPERKKSLEAILQSIQKPGKHKTSVYTRKTRR